MTAAQDDAERAIELAENVIQFSQLISSAPVPLPNNEFKPKPTTNAIKRYILSDSANFLLTE